jgi:AraC-like DNA-binding protein
VIARQVGYQDQFHFSKVFKRKLGCSPSHYRELPSRHSGRIGNPSHL